jgi:DNA-binding SARP family transcriptional activator
VAVEYRLLGPLEALEDGPSIGLGAPKQRSVLAVLLLHANEVVPVERLIDQVWGEEPPETAVNILQGYVSDLRRALGKDAIATRGHGYSMPVERSRIDLHRFERLCEQGSEALADGRASEAVANLREGLALWRGPALADLGDEPFARPAVGRLEELRLAALEKRIDADLMCGRHAEVVAELKALVADQPLRERFRGQLMLALYRTGRQAEALEVYQAARRELADELGIDPSSGLQDLEKAILIHDPALDVGATTRARSAEATGPRRSVLVVSVDEEASSPAVGIGRSLARRPAHELIVAQVVADEDALASTSARLESWRASIGEVGIDVRAAAYISARHGQDIVRLATAEDVALLLLDAPPTLLEEGLPDADLAVVLADAPCDVALLVARDGVDEGVVLVPFGGADNDWAAVELGAWVAGAWSAPLRLVGVSAAPDAGKRDASRLLLHASLAVQRALGVAAEPLLALPGEEGIIAASEDAGILVVGLSSRWHREGLGPARLALARHARAPTVLVRRGVRPGGLAPPEKLTRFTWSVRAEA